MLVAAYVVLQNNIKKNRKKTISLSSYLIRIQWGIPYYILHKVLAAYGFVVQYTTDGFCHHVGNGYLLNLFA